MATNGPTVLRHLLLVAWLLAASIASASELAGRIVGVVDGDTVDLLTDDKQVVRIRLAGIDAPERKQPFGSVAKKALSALVFAKRASLRGSKQDRYGRLIAKVLVDGRDANLTMVSLGYAWHYKRHESEQDARDRTLYSAAQESAMRERRGLWRDPKPIAPWEFRAARRAEVKSNSRLP